MAPPKNQHPLSVPDLTAERIQALRELLPEAFSEGKIDFEELRAALGDSVEDGSERYSFSWAGKRDALRLLQTPTRATLPPCPEESFFNHEVHEEHEGRAKKLSDLRGDFFSTQNVFIEGDNLEALKLLYKPYFGRTKMIYIDPLGRYLELTGQQDATGNRLTSKPKISRRYHSAWLNMNVPAPVFGKAIAARGWRHFCEH